MFRKWAKARREQKARREAAADSFKGEAAVTVALASLPGLVVDLRSPDYPRLIVRLPNA